MKIITHPDNLNALKARIEQGEFGKQVASTWWSHFGIEIVTKPLMERDKPTGKYIMPSGRVVTKDDIWLADRWIEYGPEDLSWLLYAGLLKEQREMLFYMLDDLQMRFKAMSVFSPVFTPRLSFIARSSF